MDVRAFRPTVSSSARRPNALPLSREWRSRSPRIRPTTAAPLVGCSGLLGGLCCYQPCGKLAQPSSLLLSFWDLKAARLFDGLERTRQILAGGDKNTADDYPRTPNALTTVHCHVSSHVERIDDFASEFGDRLSRRGYTPIRNRKWPEVDSTRRGRGRLAFQDQVRLLVGLEE
jgi:hypothetical protein